MTPRERVRCLRKGGLLGILREGTGGAPPLRAWLRRGRKGSTSYVFADGPPVEGAVGGAPIPVAALRGDRIRTDAKAAVGAYLLTFGLNHEQARRVILTVGVTHDVTTCLGAGGARAPCRESAPRASIKSVPAAARPATTPSTR
jgi:hypothetical protein